MMQCLICGEIVGNRFHCCDRYFSTKISDLQEKYGEDEEDLPDPREDNREAHEEEITMKKDYFQTAKISSIN
jgi:hypothetical protein